MLLNNVYIHFQLDYSQLFKVVHENDLTPRDVALWEHSMQANMEHFHYSILSLDLMKKYPVIYSFLQEVCA